jgi:hypothetical protein
VTADEPTIRVLSLGAGVQSTAVAILAARGDLPQLDAAIFADTGWEPAAVYAHLDRLDREVLQPAGIPLYRVSAGNIRNDALDPEHRFASMPLYVKARRGESCTGGCEGTGNVLVSFTVVPCPRCRGTSQEPDGMARRQCTGKYKLDPIKEELRRLLGAPLREDGVPGRVPKGRWAEQWIGISTDESHRALTSKTGVSYARPRYPLLEPTIAEGMSRADCMRINVASGFPGTPKSACIGCPFHSNAQWRQLRDEHPEEFADAVAFDAAIRHGSARANAQGQPLRGQMYLHRSRVPLSEAPIDRVTWREWASRQGDLLDEIGDAGPVACSPFGCRVEETSEEVVS